MSYVRPQDVRSPRRHWKAGKVLYDGGEGGFSVTEGQWKNEEGRREDRVGIRWNGKAGSKIGNPQSSGHPTWFVLPPDLERAVRESVEALVAASGSP